MATSAPSAAARTTIEHLESYPNPFNPKAQIRFVLSEPAPVDLVVYDAAGRVVRTIASGERLAAGEHERAWNGRDDAGRIVGGGVYHARLRAGGEAETTRLVLLK